MARKKRKRPHGTGSYQYRDGRHVVQWTENGRRRTKTLATAEEVAPFLARANAGLEVQTPLSAEGANLASLAETWLLSRAEMASNYDDRNRWKNHLQPLLGFMKPDQVDVPVLKRVILELRGKGLAKGTVRLCVALLSSLYGDLVEDGVARLNPVRLLSRKTRTRELRSDWDPKKAPYLRSEADVARVYRALEEIDWPVARAFALGARLGLRTSEVRALRWEHLDLGRRVAHVQVQASRRGDGFSDLKDGEARMVPVPDDLLALLERVPAPHRVGVVAGIPGKFQDHPLGLHRIGETYRAALEHCGIPRMRWYEGTRHTFASLWVLNGGTLETLREMMGHSSVSVTERYAHLAPGNYSDVDRARVAVDLTPPAQVPALVN